MGAIDINSQKVFYKGNSLSMRLITSPCSLWLDEREEGEEKQEEGEEEIEERGERRGEERRREEKRGGGRR